MRHVVLACIFWVGLSGTGLGQSNAEAEVRRVILGANAAYAANDLPTYWSFYAGDLTQWWPSGRVDLPTYQREWTEFIAGGGRIGAADVSDLVVQVGPSGDTAVASYRLRVVTRSAGGTETTEDNQETDVLFKRAGEWKIVHLHYSPAAR